MTAFTGARRVENTEKEAIAAGTYPVGGWKLKRAYWFHVCKDTKKLIWPLTMAYYTDLVDITIRLQLRGPMVATWVTAEAYTFRKLAGDSE